MTIKILPNKDLFVEETAEGRLLYYNSEGSMRWSFYNRADDGDIYRVGWSRILYTDEDIQSVNNFLIKNNFELIDVAHDRVSALYKNTLLIP